MKAFPDGSTNEWGNATSGGMDLRDYFAAAALQGLLANPKLHEEIMKMGQSWITDSAYGWADAMLEARVA
jgi:hypothetical protein